MLRGIRNQLLGLVIVTVVPFVALIGGGLWTQWQRDEAQAIKSALTDAELVANQVDDEIGNLENLLVGLSQAVSTRPSGIPANDAILRHVKAELPGYISNLLLSSPAGDNIGTSFETPDEGRSYFGDRDFFQKVVAGRNLAIGEPVRGRTTGHWVITIARRIEGRSGRLEAVISIGIQAEHFQDAIRLSELPPGSVIQIVNENGTVITRNADSSSWVGRNLRDDSFAARHQAAKQASEAVRWPDNVERITGSATMHRTPWLISVGLPTDVAFANTVSRLKWGAGASSLALLLAFGLAWAFSGRIIRPLRHLRDDATSLAAGDLTHRTGITTQGEVGALASAFNAMAASLEARHRELDLAREAASIEAKERARLEQLERQAKETLAAVIDASPVAIVCSDLDRRIVVWSRAAQEIFGYPAEETLGMHTKLLPPEEVAASQELFERCLKGEAVRDLEVRRKRKDGSLVDIELAATPMYNPDGSVWGVAWAYDDITERKKAERLLSHLAHFDQLTGLPNRVTLKTDLAQLLARRDHDRPHSVVLFDLDGFKDVNDTDGHSTGDQLLVEVARRLSAVATHRGKVYRLGGDEFVVVIPDCGDPRAAAELVEPMLKQLDQPFDFNEHEIHIGGSAGIAIAPQDGTTVDELIANADLALYKAKSDGGHAYRLFVPVLRAQAQSRRGLQFELRRAFAENEFELHFQPQIKLADETVVGAEALLRWRHPTRGIVAPGAFIETLAESSIAPAVGRWIIHDACQRAAAWRAQGLSLGRIGVNLFPSQCRDTGLTVDVEDALRSSGLPPELLELEISETVALNHDDAIAPLKELRDRGVKLAFDDFGTGYASLSYLTRFPVSRIKIDRSFVIKVADNAEDAAIVRSLIAMAHNLGLAIIAEGVETTAQARFLLDHHCEEAQGFLYAKPLSAIEFAAYLRNQRLSSQTADFGPAHAYHGHHVQPSARSNRRRPRA